VYLCVSSVTDPTQAPAGCQNWFVLVNVDARLSLDVTNGVEAAERTLNLHNLSLYDDAEFVDVRGPRDIAERTGAPHGAIYGRSSNGPTAALARQSNKGRQPGTYFVGGGAHPGGGLPLVLSGAKTVTRLIAQDNQ
jgi:phytoene dehydrogenase-like protein